VGDEKINVRDEAVMKMKRALSLWTENTNPSMLRRMVIRLVQKRSASTAICQGVNLASTRDVGQRKECKASAGWLTISKYIHKRTNTLIIIV
jgi:hypothetical protein